MLHTVLTWWFHQLRSLLPERWRDPALRLPDALIVDCGRLDAPADPPALFQRRRRRERPLGPLAQPMGRVGPRPAAHAGRCVLRLAGAPLQRDVILPSAVEADMARVLAYDMGRLSPFDAADVFWAWRLIRRDETRKRLTVHLWYVPRRPVQPLLDRLLAFGLAPEALELVAPSGRVMQLRLREPAGRRRPAWVAIPAALLLLALAALPFLRQSWQLHALAAQQAALAPQAAQVELLLNRFASHAPSPAVRAAEAKRSGDMMQALAAVTNGLPDDTVLGDITIRQRQVTMTGTSEQAARLIDVLSASRVLHDPAFVAPIVHDPSTGRDSFSLHAGMAP